MVIWVIKIFLYSSSVYSCHLFLISSASVKSILFLSFIVPIFAPNVPLVSLTSLKRSLVFHSLLFSSISLHMLLETSGEIAPGGMKRLSQSRNNVQLWICLVVKVKSNTVRTILHRNLECQVHESRQIGSGHTGDGKSEYQHFRNQ